MKKILWVFNLETNLDNPILAFTHDWIEEFSYRFDKVKVFSTHLGRTNLPENVDLMEIGGGNFRQRTQGLFKLFKVSLKIFENRNNSLVFHHMNSRSASIIGLPLRGMKVPQILWYSHSVASRDLWLAQKSVNYIVTSTPGSYPKHSKKVRYVGHGINTKRFRSSLKSKKNTIDILSVGRITEIKKLDEILFALEKIRKDLDFEPSVKFIGPTENKEYLNKLINIAENYSINLKIQKELTYARIPEEYSKASIYFTGTPKSVDKATLEAAMSGCLVVSDNDGVHTLTGMQEVWNNLGFQKIPTVSEQLKFLLKQPETELEDLRRLAANFAIERNDLVNTVSRIKLLLEKND